MKKILIIFLAFSAAPLWGDCLMYNDTQDSIWILQKNKRFIKIMGGPRARSVKLEQRKMVPVPTPFRITDKNPDRYNQYPPNRLVPDIFEVDDTFCKKYSHPFETAKGPVQALKFTSTRNVIATTVPLKTLQLKKNEYKEEKL